MNAMNASMKLKCAAIGLVLLPFAATAQVVDHATMDHSTMPHMPAAAPIEPITPIPEITDADRAAAMPPSQDHAMHDNGIFRYLSFNRLEAWDADPGTGVAWEGQGWVGTDLDRLWLRSEGEQVGGRLHSADLEALYGHSISPWWDVVAGVRHDFKPGESQDFVAIGVMGLSPYKFEIAATAYIGQSGQAEARFEAEYEALLTNRLILQPLVEINVFGKNDERRGIGSGLGTVEAGLRLRYEFTRWFAPYVGAVRERAFGRTAEFRRGDGESVDDTRLVAGLRMWF
jgi:copper resistance protein B